MNDIMTTTTKKIVAREGLILFTCLYVTSGICYASVPPPYLGENGPVPGEHIGHWSIHDKLLTTLAVLVLVGIVHWLYRLIRK